MITFRQYHGRTYGIETDGRTYHGIIYGPDQQPAGRTGPCHNDATAEAIARRMIDQQQGIPQETLA